MHLNFSKFTLTSAYIYLDKMYKILLNMYVKTMVLVVLYSVELRSNESRKSEFHNASMTCEPGHQIADKSVFRNCQPEGCEKMKLGDYSISPSLGDDDQDIRWINAYVSRSPAMEFHGCFNILKFSDTLNSQDQKTEYTENDVLTCSRFCKSKGGVLVKVIILQEFKCYCVQMEALTSWKTKGQAEEVSTTDCSKECPNDPLDRCGGTHTNTVSVYKFVGGDDLEDMHLGSNCFSTGPDRNANSRPKRVNCFDGTRNVTTQCYPTYFNWYQAERKCLRQKGYLPTYTPSNQKCGLNTDLNTKYHWHNTFIKEKIIWDKENKPAFSHECLAIELGKDMNHVLLAAECSNKYQALCVRKFTSESSSRLTTPTETTNTEDKARTTTVVVTVSSDRHPRAVDMKNPSSNNPNVELYIAVPISVAVLIVSVIVTVICIRRRRKRKTNENENEENLSAVYYSTVPDEVTLKKDSDLPLADANGACLVNETDVYNHLGDTDQQNHSDVTGPVYDHTGLQDNDQYDISVISEKRTNKDGDDLNHYDLMQVIADINSVYDETSTARKTNNDKSIDSVDIYDHAKQTESDYDTTDTQKQHEQRDHVHEPTYDQSGSCENLREPTYDQSGPCEHLTDPMYDQSDSLGADIYEKCETKQSTIDEQ